MLATLAMLNILLKPSHIFITVNPRFKPWRLIDFMVHNHPGSNQERAEFKTIN